MSGRERPGTAPFRPMPGARALALLALAALSSCAEPPVTAEAPREVDRMVIAPYAMHEECAHLAAGERLDYRYESSAPLDFNLHYHEANAVLSPVVRERSTGDSGIFEARLAQDYCLMWQAGAPGAIIRYRVAVRRSPPR